MSGVPVDDAPAALGAGEPPPPLTDALRTDVDLVSALPIVPRILDACARETGLRFVAVARVTDARWVACASADGLDLGLGPGDQIPAASTLCSEALAADAEIALDDARSSARYADHPFVTAHGVRGFVSVPVRLPDGEAFGTLCAFDPEPAEVAGEETLESLRLYAELVAAHVDAARRLHAGAGELAAEREAAELREQLLAVLGHDLRNPLGAIDANAQLVEAVTEDGTVLEAARSIGRSVARMSELVGNLLDLARQRRGETMVLEVESAPELAARLRQVIEELAVAHPGRRVEARVHDHAGVACDPDRVAQLLSNLLGNALRHGTGERPVTVETSLVDGVFRLAVENAGPPIPEDVRARLFRPFRRGDERDGDPGAMSGLGLGLYIAHQIALAHGGAIECRSDERGTRFAFAMPAAGPVAMPGADDSPNGTSPDGTSPAAAPDAGPDGRVLDA